MILYREYADLGLTHEWTCCSLDYGQFYPSSYYSRFYLLAPVNYSSVGRQGTGECYAELLWGAVE